MCNRKTEYSSDDSDDEDYDDEDDDEYDDEDEDDEEFLATSNHADDTGCIYRNII